MTNTFIPIKCACGEVMLTQYHEITIGSITHRAGLPCYTVQDLSTGTSSAYNRCSCGKYWMYSDEDESFYDKVVHKLNRPCYVPDPMTAAEMEDPADYRVPFEPNNHIIGKVYTVDAANFNALLKAWEQLQHENLMLVSENEVLGHKLGQSIGTKEESK